VSSAASGSSSRRVFAASVRSRRMRSTARFRAVLISHARGLSGVPSRGQRAAAIANASCAASSARSKSPRKPIRAARTCPHCSRKGLVEAGGHSTIGRTSIAPPKRAGRDLRGQLDRGVEVVALIDEPAAHRLLQLDERAVGGQRPAVLHPHGRGHLGRLQAHAGGHARVLVDRLVGGVHRAPLLIRQGIPLVGAGQAGWSLGESASGTSSCPPFGNGRV